MNEDTDRSYMCLSSNAWTVLTVGGKRARKNGCKTPAVSERQLFEVPQ